jgi:hypothetical protein
MMKNIEIKLPFGLNIDNVIVHIENVESGGECNCMCLDCKSPLIAVKGSIRQHHFRHKDVNECKGGLESAIHQAAKQIIIEKKQIKLPELVSIATEADSRGKKHSERKLVVQDGTIVKFDSVEEEKTLHEMKADILAMIAGKQLIVEIFYRHKVDDGKIAKIKKANISAVEVDLSNLTPEDVKDWNNFWSCINDARHVKWLHNVKAHVNVYPKLVNKLAETILMQEKQYEYEESIKKEQEHVEKAQLLQALDDLKTLRSKEYITQLKQNVEKHLAWKRSSEHLKLTLDKLPHFLDVDVPDGDWIFGCDRRVWQTAFYNSFICRNGKPFCVKRVDEWLNNNAMCKVHPSVKRVGIYGRRYPNLIPAEVSRRLPSSWKALQAYFWHLFDIGMLEFSGEDYRHRGNEWFKVKSKTPYTGQYQFGYSTASQGVVEKIVLCSV